MLVASLADLFQQWDPQAVRRIFCFRGFDCPLIGQVAHVSNQELVDAFGGVSINSLEPLFIFLA